MTKQPLTSVQITAETMSGPMLDDTMGPLIVSATAGAKFPVSTDLHTTFFKGVSIGPRRVVEARIDRVGRSTVFTSAVLKDENGGVLAQGIHAARLMVMRPMTRRSFIRTLGLAVAAWITPVYVRAGEDKVGDGQPAAAFDPVDKPLSSWRELLEPRRYAVLFEEDTERPFSSPLDNEKREGAFICAACFLPLFESKTKFDSGTGWPSFWAPIDGRVATKTDYLLFFPRTEYHCARCGGHQGHLFSDGPQPTGQRWCNNGLALQFVPSGKPFPDLRT